MRSEGRLKEELQLDPMIRTFCLIRGHIRWGAR